MHDVVEFRMDQDRIICLCITQITSWLEQMEHLIQTLAFGKMRPDTKTLYIFIRNFDFHMKSIRQLSCNLLQRQIIKMKMAVAPTGSRIIFFCFFFL